MGIHKNAMWLYWIPTCPITTKLGPFAEQKARLSTHREWYNSTRASNTGWNANLDFPWTIARNLKLLHVIFESML